MVSRRGAFSNSVEPRGRVPEISVTDANAVAKLKIIQANNQSVFVNHGGNFEATEKVERMSYGRGGRRASTSGAQSKPVRPVKLGLVSAGSPVSSCTDRCKRAHVQRHYSVRFALDGDLGASATRHSSVNSI